MKKTNPFKLKFRVTEAQQVGALRRELSQLRRRQHVSRSALHEMDYEYPCKCNEVDSLRYALAESQRKRKLELVWVTVAYLAGSSVLILMGAF